jgi:hypothetical protein
MAELSSERLESDYAVAGHLRVQTRYDQRRYWWSQATSLAISGAMPLAAYLWFDWGAMSIAVLLMVDAWTVLLATRW